MRKVGVAVKDTVGRDDANLVALIHGWELANEVAATERTPYQKIWTTGGGSTSVLYVEDALLGLRYFQIRGEEPERVVKQLKDALEVYDEGELAGMLGEGREPREAVRALHVAAVTAPSAYDEGYFELFEKGFAHPEAEVRRAAVFAVAYVGWREFRAPLERLRALDAEAGPDAAVMLSSLEQHNWR